MSAFGAKQTFNRIDNMLAEALEEIDNATEHVPLVRANSKWRAVTWDSFNICNISDRGLSLCS